MTQSYDPFKIMSSSLALWADATRNLQSQYTETLARALEQAPTSLEWKTLEIPFLAPNFGSSDKQLQEAFQTMANINVSAWTHTADMLAALPEWARAPTNTSSRAFRQFFEQALGQSKPKSL